MLSWLISLIGQLQRPSKRGAPALSTVLLYETQSFPETLARIAESQIGVTEVGGNNRGPQVQEYQRSTWLAGTGWAWCAAFVCWCILRAMEAHGLKPTTWQRPRTAGAYDFENWARGTKPHPANGAWRCFHSTPQNPPRRGDIITFTWSHIGIVTGYDPATRTIYTVEGNAGGTDRTDSPTGDGVFPKKHHVTKCRCLIRYVA